MWSKQGIIIILLLVVCLVYPRGVISVSHSAEEQKQSIKEMLSKDPKIAELIDEFIDCVTNRASPEVAAKDFSQVNQNRRGFFTALYCWVMSHLQTVGIVIGFLLGSLAQLQLYKYCNSAAVEGPGSSGASK